ncbi:hypothetical protein Cs7R123_55560 [Catellatospora sp. TT07R-123]|uniref:hypothetical protein n=1 Tax=Catellatospora sp. TT07R-123 TaxID=2733863 RepID=UPI001B2D0F53|nr:hypothetical protein [Catellatospora sp. TT07R-123]GHJ48214.1 hypothetical protein Cs7R123_55560 [Catellatospora sp. TT07R-123]
MTAVLKKGVAISVAVGAVGVAAGVAVWKLDPWGLVSKRVSGRKQNSASMGLNPVAEKVVDDKQEAREGAPSE